METYVRLDESQQEQFQELMGTELYREAKPFMITTYERGKADGKLEGREKGKLEAGRETAILLLETKFGSLPSKVHQRITEMAPQQLRQLLVNVVKVPSLSLKELQLDD